MKVAVPCDTPFGLNAQRSGHFGHCAFFTVATIEGNEVTDVQVVPNVDHDEVGCGGVIDFALSLGIDAIIAAGMGVPPFTRFSNGGVKVYLEQTQPIAGDAIKVLMDGKAVEMSLDQACAH